MLRTGVRNLIGTRRVLFSAYVSFSRRLRLAARGWATLTDCRPCVQEEDTTQSAEGNNSVQPVCDHCIVAVLVSLPALWLTCTSLQCYVQQQQAAHLVSDARAAAVASTAAVAGAGAGAGEGAGVGAGGVPSASAPCELPATFLEDIFGPSPVVHSARFKDVWSQKCNEHGLNPAQLRVFFKDVGACSYLPRHIIATYAACVNASAAAIKCDTPRESCSRSQQSALHSPSQKSALRSPSLLKRP